MSAVEEPSAPRPTLTPDVGSRRAAGDIAVQIVGRLGNLMLGIVATALLARGLGNAGYGMWTTVLLVPSLLGYLTELGLQQVAVRQAAATDDLRWVGALATVRLITALPVFVLAAVCFVVIGVNGTTFIAGMIVSSQVLLGAPAAIAVVFQLRVRNDYAILGMTFNNVLWTSAVALLMARDAGLVPLAAVLVLVAGATNLGQAFVVLRSTSIPFRGGGRYRRELVRIAIPLSIGSILIAAYGKIDGLIVYSAGGAEEAGYYGAAYRILDQAAFIPMSLTVTLAPILARTWPRDRPRARRILQLAIELLAMAGFFAIAFAAAAPEQSVRFLYGADFVRAGDALLPLMIAYAAICAGFTCGMYTLVLGLNRRFAVYALIALVFNVTANLLLVPPYGFVAAAWVTAATEILVTGLIARDILRVIELRFAVGRLIRVAVCAALAGLAVVPLRDQGVPLPLLLAAGGAVHVVGLLVLRALRPDELRALLRREP